MTWSVRRLCRMSRSFTCRVQMCDPTSIRLVEINIPQISLKIVWFFEATQRQLVRSPIRTREVNERLILYNLHIDHVRIKSQLRYLIGDKVAGTVIWNRGLGTTRAQSLVFMSGLGNNPANTMQVGFLARTRTKPNQTASHNPDRWMVTRTRC